METQKQYATHRPTSTKIRFKETRLNTIYFLHVLCWCLPSLV